MKTNKINGHKLRAAISLWESRQKTTVALFTKSLTYFPGPNEIKPDPAALAAMAASVEEANKAVSHLLAARARYNSLVTVDLDGEKLPLLEALVRLGPTGQLVKLWKNVLNPSARDSYREYRTKDDIYPVPSMDHEAMRKAAEATEAVAAQLREVIATANLTEVSAEEIGLDPIYLK